MAEESQGFTVRDRRVLSGEREESPAQEQKGATEAKTSGAQEQRSQEEPPREIPLPEPTFSAFLTSFFLPQVLTFLGEIPHPETQQPERNLPMAKYLIDTLALIKEKTRGNLTSDEQSHLDSLLTDLRLLYVKAVRV